MIRMTQCSWRYIPSPYGCSKVTVWCRRTRGPKQILKRSEDLRETFLILIYNSTYMKYLYSTFLIVLLVTENVSAYVIKLRGWEVSDGLYILMSLCIPLSLITFLVYYCTRNTYKTFSNIMKFITGVLFIIWMMVLFWEMY